MLPLTPVCALTHVPPAAGGLTRALPLHANPGTAGRGDRLTAGRAEA